MQKLLTLAITVTIIYLVITHSSALLQLRERTSQKLSDTNSENIVSDFQSKDEIEMKGNIVERALSNVIYNILQTEEGKIFFENLIKPINEPIAGKSNIQINDVDFLTPLLKINNFGTGTEGPASCGHVVTIHYKILSLNNILIKEGHDTITLGSNKLAPGLDIVVIGMRVGQTRHATIPTKYFSTDPKQQNSYFKLQVTLHNIIPNNYVEDAKIFDDQISYRLPLVCGMKAEFDARITDLGRNKVIFDSKSNGKTLRMQIGDIKYPVIFSHALHNKITSGTRTVITKGKYLKSYLSDYSIIFPKEKFPEQNLYMIEFSNFAANSHNHFVK
ncbi:MAG: FKBP-type peptidyl-prolyl cis-trans isomerase [Rickettsiaceae bacterium]|nr:FKBP-type peptidyl-prolyl cis-trans isomerase [Rickettsiaceae bacterium]